MSGALAQHWWTWIAPASAQFTLFALVLGGLERVLPGRSPTALRAALLWSLWTLALLSIGAVMPSTVSTWNPLAPTWESLRSVGGAAPAAFDPAPAWIPALAVVWLTGVAWTVSAWGRTWRRERRAARIDARAAPLSVQREVARLARELGLAQAPRVRVSERASGPATYGALTSTIVLPAEWLAKSAPLERRHVLLHELAHVRRRDGMAAVAWAALRVVLWFHPLAHWAAARAAVLRELGADERAAARCGSIAEYRRTLLTHARALIEPPAFAAGFFPSRAAILSRLSALERDALPHAVASRALAAATFLAAVACCAPLATRAVATPAFEDLQGCLRKRYVVLAALAAERASHPSPFESSDTTKP